MNNAVDVGKLIDDGPFTTLQKIAVFLAALSIVLDGFDGQLIGYAIPGILKEWGITRGAFAPAVAAGDWPPVEPDSRRPPSPHGPA